MRNDVSIETYERLFAESGGLCAKPGCGTVLFGSSAGFAGEAVAVAGTSGEGREFSRENPESAENLVLLCPACGGEAGSGSLAPGELMRWKRELDARPSAEIPGELRRALVHMKCTTWMCKAPFTLPLIWGSHQFIIWAFTQLPLLICKLI